MNHWTAAKIGFFFGLIAVPVATLGLSIRIIEIVFTPIIFVPRAIMQLLPTASMPGLLSVAIMALVSGIFYGIVGFALYKLL